MMVSEPVLVNIMEYFLEHFGLVPEFRRIGSKTRNEIVESFLERAASDWHQTQPIPNSYMLIEIPQHQFIHGACELNIGMLNVLYFGDIKTGLIVSAGSRVKKSQLMRFNLEQLPHGYESRN
jgi:hypothetical protein